MSYFLWVVCVRMKWFSDCTFCTGVPNKHLLLYYFMCDSYFYCATAFSCSVR